MQKKAYYIVFTVLLMCLAVGKSYGQGYDDITNVNGINGNYSFSLTEIPERLVSVNPDLGGTVWQWEQSDKPVTDFADISGEVNSILSFSAVLSGTMYYRRRATRNGQTYYSNTIKYSLVSVNFENIRYIREHTILVAGETNWASIDQLPIGKKLMTTNYLDAFGRSVQKISTGTATPADPNDPSSLWGDMVQFSKYDAFGRQSTRFLPYTTTTAPGKFKTGVLTEQPAYYHNKYNETYAFSNITYNNSPINRINSITSVGEVGATATYGHSMGYDFNKAADNVQNFTISTASGALPANMGVFADNELMKTTSFDENKKEVVEYTNKSGQLVLRKVQLDEIPSSAYNGWICTYNVYDDFGQLRFQIQPEAVKWLEQNGWDFIFTSGGQMVADNLCFVYEYDAKGRNILKKAPGAKALKMLYDSRDRMVCMQDGNQRNMPTPQWTVNLFDQLDRPTTSTLYNTSTTAQQLQQTLDVTTFGIYTNNLPGGFIFTQTALNDPLQCTILKYNFYDDYSYAGAIPFNTNFQNSTAYSTGAEPIVTTERTLSMVTGTKVRVLGTNTFLMSSVYYDEKGRSIQATEQNIKSGTDVATMQYGFDGRLMSTHTIHSAGSTAYTNHSIITKNTFDLLGRITGIEKKFGANPFKAIGKYAYDDIGRLKQKRLAPGYTGTGKQEIETLNYSYNIYGNITGINKDFALKTAGTYNKWDNFFGMYLGYDNRDNVFANRQVDGHVAGILWNTQGDDAQRRYDYSYDNAGRLNKADFTEKQQPGDTWNNSKMDFSIGGGGGSGKIEYDLNGNLLTMLHKGILPGTAAPVTVDNLRYTYATLSNKLLAVTDAGNLGTNNGKLGDFKDGTNGTADDYVYDDNGNLIVDLNKNVLAVNANVGGIKYNYLDKPEEIKITGKGTIKFVYDADGSKLQKIFTPEAGGTTTTTTYINGYEYKENLLQFISFEEGRLRVVTPTTANNGFDYLTIDGNADMPDAKRGAFDYFIKDYQGNVRMMLTEETHTGSNICTMETNRDANEAPLFGKTDANGIPISGNEVQARFAVSGIPGQAGGTGWNNTLIGSYVSKVGALTSSKVGPNTLLKVMAGDKVSATSLYYYKNAVVNNSGNNTVLNSIIAALTSAISGSAGTTGLVKAGSTSGIASNLSTSYPLDQATAPDAANPNGTNPKAYLTVLFFDERFNFVGEGSSTDRVKTAGDNAIPLTLANIKAPKNGYAYIYVSNESDEPVYFDNIRVVQERGRITEENHYYAYGLKIAGISSRKLGDANEGRLQNNYQYNGDESEYDDDIQWNDYPLRNYDPQIGRWVQQDPYQEFASGYVGMADEPIGTIDPSGGSIGTALIAAVGSKALLVVGTTIIGGLIGGISDMISGRDDGKGVIIGASVGLLVGLEFCLGEVGRPIKAAAVDGGAAAANNEADNEMQRRIGRTLQGSGRGGPNVKYEYAPGDVYLEFTGETITKRNYYYESAEKKKVNEPFLTTETVKGTVKFTDENGNVLQDEDGDLSFEIVTGYYGNGATPDGDYDLGPVESSGEFPYDEGVKDYKGRNGFKIELLPRDPSIKRTRMLFHPAENATKGCLGVKGKKNQIRFIKAIEKYKKKIKGVKVKKSRGTKSKVIGDDGKYKNKFPKMNQETVNEKIN